MSTKSWITRVLERVCKGRIVISNLRWDWRRNDKRILRGVIGGVIGRTCPLTTTLMINSLQNHGSCARKIQIHHLFWPQLDPKPTLNHKAIVSQIWSELVPCLTCHIVSNRVSMSYQPKKSLISVFIGLLEEVCTTMATGLIIGTLRVSDSINTGFSWARNFTMKLGIPSPKNPLDMLFGISLCVHYLINSIGASSCQFWGLPPSYTAGIDKCLVAKHWKYHWVLWDKVWSMILHKTW